MSKASFKGVLTTESSVILLSLGARIDNARRARRESASMFAASIGTSRGTYYRMVNGDPGVSSGVLIEAMNALDLLDKTIACDTLTLTAD